MLSWRRQVRSDEARGHCGVERYPCLPYAWPCLLVLCLCLVCMLLLRANLESGSLRMTHGWHTVVSLSLRVRIIMYHHIPRTPFLVSMPDAIYVYERSLHMYESYHPCTASVLNPFTLWLSPSLFLPHSFSQMAPPSGQGARRL